MPNRILRDWTDSEKIDMLSCEAERFFTRLIMKVDDYGRYNGSIKFIKSTLFPLKTDISEIQISSWLTECESLGLVLLYNVLDKSYLQIENFKQVLRQKHEKYPMPSTCLADATQTTSTCLSSASLNRIETETNRKEVERDEKTFFLIHEMQKSFLAVNPKYNFYEPKDNPALFEIAKFISTRKFKTETFTNLTENEQRQILTEFGKVATWYKAKEKTNSLEELVKFKLQEMFNSPAKEILKIDV